MEHEQNRQLIHSYDTERHAVRCGEIQQTHSTKHARDVTCPTCRDLLDERTNPRSSTGQDHHAAR
jgi:hypothetical protein